jgi:hypothetical protein
MSSNPWLTIFRRGCGYGKYMRSWCRNVPLEKMVNEDRYNTGQDRENRYPPFFTGWFSPMSLKCLRVKLY